MYLLHDDQEPKIVRVFLELELLEKLISIRATFSTLSALNPLKFPGNLTSTCNVHV
jgi:hypothetical protein